MEHREFIEYVCKKLQELSAVRKDAWIVERAELISENEQQDFIMSLTGEKKITYMPTEAEIDEFCKKVQSGEICVEYETHYFEFDTDGRYMDDWKTWHNDPYGAFPFLDRVFRGCRDLLHLGEYATARKILDQVCCLKFQVVEAEDSEDGLEDDTPFAIVDVGKEQKLSMQMYEIGFLWLEALLLDKQEKEEAKLAKKLLEVFQNEICKKVDPHGFEGLISEKVLDLMEEILETEIREIDGRLQRLSGEMEHWRERHQLEEKRARKQHLLLDIRKKCKKAEREEEAPNQVSVLAASWKQIKELFRTLSYERYIDDQLEIDEVWNISQALIKRDRFKEEDWKIRKEILREIIAHGYYDCYGCYDPIEELAKKLYITEEETLEYADLLNERGCYAREAAELYLQYGKTDKYVRYLETHLGRSSKEYVELIPYYYNGGKKTRAREIAEQGLKQCKDDLTDLFIFLLQDAKACNEEERYKKFYASAKRRKLVDIARVNEAMK